MAAILVEFHFHVLLLLLVGPDVTVPGKGDGQLSKSFEHQVKQ